MRVRHALLAAAAAAGLGAAGVLWLVPGEAELLRRQLDDTERQREALRQAIERLTGEDRVAEVHVVDQAPADAFGGTASAGGDWTVLEFVELDRQGHPLPSRRFVVPDRVVFFDALVVKFDHRHVAAADALRGKSLALFRRVYGQNQPPAEGQPIDPAGDVPNVFRVQPHPNEFERRLWTQFWRYVRDPAAAAEEGVRVVQGEAVYVPMRKGDVWTLSLEHNGGLNIRLRRASDPATP